MVDARLGNIGARIQRERLAQTITLEAVASRAGISVPHLSRIETGQRQPSLQVLLAIADGLSVDAGVLVGGRVASPDPVIRPSRSTGYREGHRVIWPLTRRPGHANLQAFKVRIDPLDEPIEPRVHEGVEWIYVLSGELLLHLDGVDRVLVPGEAAEFDTMLPHAIRAHSDQPVETLQIFGREGARIHYPAASRGETDNGEPGEMFSPGQND